MWRHVEGVRPVADREGTRAMKDLLAATTGPDGTGCRLTEFSEAYRRGTSTTTRGSRAQPCLTEFSEAYRRGTPYPDLSEGELKAVKRWIRPAIDALITEALVRSGATREDLRRERRSSSEPS